jgi:hypothetical protein
MITIIIIIIAFFLTVAERNTLLINGQEGDVTIPPYRRDIIVTSLTDQIVFMATRSWARRINVYQHAAVRRINIGADSAYLVRNAHLIQG